MSHRKLLSFIVCLAILLTGFVVADKMPVASGGTNGAYESPEPVTPSESDFTYKAMPTNNPTKAYITSYTGKETKIIIPETLGGLPVTTISANAFANNENITYVKLPSYVTAVSTKAFYMCSSITEFDVAEGNNTFAVIDGVLYRKDTAADSETNGKIVTLSLFPAGRGGEFTIPYGITSVSPYAFDHCFKLTKINMYNTVKIINDNAFSYCWGLESIRLSDNLTYLGDMALAYCSALTRIDLPSRLTSIGTDAVLGEIDSDDNKVYFFIDGISCTKDSYAHKYLINQALPESIIILNNASVTDNDTGIKLVDAYNVLPQNAEIDVVVGLVDIAEVKELLPTRCSRALVYDITLTKNGEPYTLTDNIIFNFEAVCDGAIASATKVYQQQGNKLVLVSGAAHTPFIGAQASSGGRFIILINDDFSLKGDIDADGMVTLFDVKAALHAATGTLTLTNEQLECANVDGSADGKITTDDARLILRLAGGMNMQ